MKFQLEPYNWGASDETLLDDLRGVARKVGKNFVTKTEYDRHGRFCPTTLQQRFGSWSRANQLAGLEKIRRFGVTAEDCLDSLRQVSNKVGKTSITTAEYLQNGGISLAVITRHFGSWKAAIESAGLTVSDRYHEKASNEELFENIEALWRLLGRQPKTPDFSEPFSRFSVAPYKRRFGSLRRALEAFVASLETQESEPRKDHLQETVSNCPPAVGIKRHRTLRNVGWRMRFLVMRRDDFRCRLCGITPALRPGTVLDVDHIVPWADGGETEMENLETLCEPCNGGKSNLPIK